MTYGLLLNLSAVPGVADRRRLERFVQRYATSICAPNDSPDLNELIDLAVNYSRDFVIPRLHAARAQRPWRPKRCATSMASSRSCRPTPRPRTSRRRCSKSASATRSRALRGWFQALYETLLGRSQGPRMGSFIALYGIDNSRRLIAEALAA